MTRAPDRYAVYAAELRFAESAQATVNGARRTRAALHAALVRPSTLGLVAGVAALSGFLLARRKPSRVRISGRRRVESAPGPSAAALAMAFFVRQALARLPAVLEQLWAARRRPVARAAPAASQPASIHSEGRVLH